MDTKTLDERLRERALCELEKEVDRKTQEIKRLLGNSGKITLKTEEGAVHIYWSCLLASLKQMAIADNREKREQQAVDDFLKRTEEISDELDELRDEEY